MENRLYQQIWDCIKILLDDKKVKKSRYIVLLITFSTAFFICFIVWPCGAGAEPDHFIWAYGDEAFITI
jgi:hypothetical protein